MNDSLYGNDPVDIVDDWVTVAEDGYLTLRFSTLWGNRGIAHKVNLLTGGNPENPYEVEFRHDACGDAGSWRSDALVAFDLGEASRYRRSYGQTDVGLAVVSGEENSGIRLLYP